jgi:hypothetical protein
MARYRKIDPRIWNDAKFSALSERGKLVFLYFLTHPHMTSLGAMRASVEGLAAEMPMQPKAFREAFREAFAKGIVKGDKKAALLWAPNFIRYNGPESPNVVKAWANAWDLLPECSLKSEIAQSLKAFAKGLPEAFAQAFTEAFGKDFAKGMPYQEQEQEQEPEQESPPIPPASGNGRHTLASAFDEFWQAYPRKTAKGAAEKNWAKIKPTPAMTERILQAITEQRQTEQWQRDGGRYIPHPATWLNQKRWEDTPLSPHDAIRSTIEHAEHLTFGNAK